MTSRMHTRALWGLAAAFLFGAAVSFAQTFERIYSFTPADGSNPQSGLIQVPDGRFMGTTLGDTLGNNGTLFQVDQSGNFLTLHRFDWNFDGAKPHSPLLIGPDGNLYGTTKDGLLGWGGIFKFDRTKTLTVLKAFVPSRTGPEGEGATPHAPLIWVPGALHSGDAYYGVTTAGGMDDDGAIFAMDPMYNVRTLHHFSGWDGSKPFESLVYVNGFLYGTTAGGGASRDGVIFRMACGGGFFQPVYSFSRPTGAKPEAPLIAVNGMLYGTTSLGGTYGKGTVFRFDPATHQMLVLHNFNGADGATPHAGLVLAHDGYLYGTTSEGGHFEFDACEGSDCLTPSGTIFRIETTMNRFQTVHTFNRWNDGANSQSRLIEGMDGSLYGTTSEGGPDNLGVVFRLVFARVDEITPTSVPPNRNVAFWLKGANFQDGASVFVGGLRALDVLVPDDANISAKTPLLPPGTIQNVVVDNPNGTRGGLLNALFVDFLDVPQADAFHPFVEKIFRNRVAGGLPDGNFGRDLPTTRGQVAVMLLRAKNGPDFYPPAATGEVFADVPANHPFAPWIEELARQGITAGCGSHLFCPDESMTRAQMAVAILKAMHGAAYTPPACHGIFGDVPCASPFAPWIELFAQQGITAGCNGGLYFCPAEPATRGQTAVFLTKAFVLP